MQERRQGHPGGEAGRNRYMQRYVCRREAAGGRHAGSWRRRQVFRFAVLRGGGSGRQTAGRWQAGGRQAGTVNLVPETNPI